MEAVARATDPLTETLVPVTIRPRASDVTVRAVALAWLPHRMDAAGRPVPAWE